MAQARQVDEFGNEIIEGAGGGEDQGGFDPANLPPGVEYAGGPGMDPGPDDSELVDPLIDLEGAAGSEGPRDRMVDNPNRGSEGPRERNRRRDRPPTPPGPAPRPDDPPMVPGPSGGPSSAPPQARIPDPSAGSAPESLAVPGSSKRRAPALFGTLGGLQGGGLGVPLDPVSNDESDPMMLLKKLMGQ